MTCYPDEVRADNPIGYWRFETSVDPTLDDGGLYPGASGGSSGGNVLFGEIPGLIGSSEGYCNIPESVTTTSWVSFGDLAAFEFPNQSPFTLEMWFKPVTVDNEVRFLLSKYQGFTAPTNGWYLAHRDDGVIFTRSRDGTDTTLIDGDPLTEGVLSYIAATYDGSDLRIYQAVSDVVTLTGGPTASSLNLSANSLDFRMANHHEGAGVSASVGWGAYDEVAVYGSALNLTRLQAHYDERDNIDCTVAREGWGILAR